MHREDQPLVHRLFDQLIPLHLVEVALTLAAARGLCHSHQAEPLSPIHSLHYILPLIDEFRQQPIDPGYIVFAAFKLQNAEREFEQIRQILEQSSAPLP